MNFRYEGVDAQGNMLRGEVSASDHHNALRQLNVKGIIVIDLAEHGIAEKKSMIQARMTQAMLVQALHELTTLITSGVTLSDAIEALIDGGHHPTIVLAFGKIGRPLS